MQCNNSITTVTLRFILVFILSFQHFTNTEKVEINFNNCRKLEVYYQCKLNNLEITSNSDGKINLTIIPPETSLNDLRIDSSNIPFIPSKFFKTFHDIKEFVAINCSIEFIYYDTFIKASKLHYLVLSHNKIQVIPDNTFRNISDLQTLKLDNNELEMLTTNVFRGLDMLRTLKLSFNKIAYLPLYIFNDLENLEILQLDNNRIRIISSEQFVTNVQLLQIDLSDNQLIIIDNGTFNGLNNLQCLNLTENICVNATIKYDENISKILECCVSSREEMTACLAARDIIEIHDSQSTNIALIVILFFSIFGNLFMFAYCFLNKRLSERMRRREEFLELIHEMSESSYQIKPEIND